MDKLNTHSEMENVKDILMSFREYWNKLPNIMIHEDDIDKYINTLKYRPREPEANECNEQAKEFAEKLISNQKDIDPEYVDIVNEHWNELLAND